MSDNWIGSWIRESRKVCNWNQTQVGQVVGVSQVRVSQWETGKSTPNDEELRMLEIAFNQKVPGVPTPTAEEPAAEEPGDSAIGTEPVGLRKAQTVPDVSTLLSVLTRDRLVEVGRAVGVSTP